MNFQTFNMNYYVLFRLINFQFIEANNIIKNYPSIIRMWQTTLAVHQKLKSIPAGTFVISRVTIA